MLSKIEQNDYQLMNPLENGNTHLYNKKVYTNFVLQNSLECIKKTETKKCIDYTPPIW